MSDVKEEQKPVEVPEKNPEEQQPEIPEDLKKLVSAHELFDTNLKLLNTAMFQRAHQPHVEHVVAGITPILADIARQIHAHPQAALVVGPKPEDAAASTTVEADSESAKA